jgi:hypothetical protein
MSLLIVFLFGILVGVISTINVSQHLRQRRLFKESLAVAEEHRIAYERLMRKLEET